MVIVRSRHCNYCHRDRIVPDEIAKNTHTCHMCALENRRRAARAYNRTHREICTRAQRNWRRRNPEKARDASRRWWARQYEDPALHQRLKENARIDYRLRREREGYEFRVVEPDEYTRRYGSAFSAQTSLDATPLMRVIDEWLDHLPKNTTRAEQADANTWQRLARMSRVPARSLRRAHDVGRVSIGVADVVCIALGTHVDLVYRETLATAERAS